MTLMETRPSCCEKTKKTASPEPNGLSSIVPFIRTSPAEEPPDEPCCGGPVGPSASPFDKAGYTIAPHVEDFLVTPIGPVPRVKTRPGINDRLGTLFTRSNIGRHSYTVAPGLYATGSPGPDSPVLVTANFKLSFDHLRFELTGTDTWILVLDTRGINVWCAAGKGTFGTEELVNRLKLSRLSELVSHRKLVVPQLGATGVSGIKVKKQSGFSVTWGPVHCRDLRRFLDNGMKADEAMRTVTFDLGERLVLIPVELSLAMKPFLKLLLAVLFVSGIGPTIFSLSAMIHRGTAVLAVLFAGIIAGTVLTPALLNRLPGTAFSVKGLIAGLLLSTPAALMLLRPWGGYGLAGSILMATAISSYLAMNFTGSTPFTSPSGVELEMKRSMPVQALAAFSGALFWLVSAF